MNRPGPRFSVNLNKFALLRSSRGGDKPNLLGIARRCVAVGVHGITVHPRVDERHIRYADVAALQELLRDHAGVELNVEGAPGERWLESALQNRPAQCTLVPDGPNQLTSDHGWEVNRHEPELRSVIDRLRAADIRVSLFVDPDPEQVRRAQGVGADRVELYTGIYAAAFGTADQEHVTRRYVAAAEVAAREGVGLNAGHDLDLHNLGHFLARVPHVLEVSIGHAVVCDCLDYGLEGTLARYLEIVRRSP